MDFAVGTAETFRTYKRLNLLPTLEHMTAYEFVCYDTAETTVEKVHNDLQKEKDKKDKVGQDNQLNRVGGKESNIPWKADKMGLKPR